MADQNEKDFVESLEETAELMKRFAGSDEVLTGLLEKFNKFEERYDYLLTKKLKNYIEAENPSAEDLDKVLGSTLQSFLPPLKTDASGCECSEKDGIDRNDRDFMRGRVQGIIESGAIGDKGWLVHTTAYEINMGVAGTAIAGHNNLEILKPDGTMFATLDTQQIDREDGAVKGYFPDGEFAAPVLDECIPGNEVVIEDNLRSGTILYAGTGPEALLRFAKASEAAVHLSKQNLNYKVLPDEGQNEANSNTLARAYAEASSNEDPLESMNVYAKNIGPFGSPGLEIDLIKEPLKSRYDGMSGEEFINNPEMVSAFCDDLKELHPISQQLRAIEFGNAEKAEAKPFEHSILNGAF